MTDTSCPKYTREIHKQIQERWGNVRRPDAGWCGACTAAEMRAWIAESEAFSSEELAWLDACLYAQDDVQILLERIEVLERMRRDDCDNYTEAIRIEAEAGLKMKAAMQQACKLLKEAE